MGHTPFQYGRIVKLIQHLREIAAAWADQLPFDHNLRISNHPIFVIAEVNPIGPLSMDVAAGKAQLLAPE